MLLLPEMQRGRAQGREYAFHAEPRAGPYAYLRHVRPLEYYIRRSALEWLPTCVSANFESSAFLTVLLGMDLRHSILPHVPNEGLVLCPE